MLRSSSGILQLIFKYLKRILWMLLFKFSIISRAIIRVILPFFIFIFFWLFYSFAIQLKKDLQKDFQTQEYVKKIIMKFKQPDIQENYYKIDFFKSISTYQKIKNFYAKQRNSKITFHILYGPFGIGKTRGNINLLNKKKKKKVPSLYINTKQQFFRQKITQNEFIKGILKWKKDPQTYYSKLFSRIYYQNFGNQPLFIVIDQISTYGSQINEEDRYNVFIQNLLELNHSGLKIVLITQYKSFISSFQKQSQQRFSLTKLGFNTKNDFIKFAKNIKFNNKQASNYIKQQQLQKKALNYIKQQQLQKTINFLRTINCFSKQTKKQENQCLNRLKFKHTLVMISSTNTKLLQKLCKNPYAKLNKKQKRQSQYLEDINYFFDDYFGTVNIFKAYSQYMKINKNIHCKIHKRFKS